MPICKPEALTGALPTAARLMALDVGDATVGVAVSDPSLTIATARTVLRRGRRFQDVADALLKMASEDRIGGVIVGLPLDLSGKPGPRAQASRAFARNLMKAFDFPTVMWDERMSTNAVERALLEADMSRKKRGAIRDAAAAAFILQGFLDYLKDSGAVSNFANV